MTLPRPTWRLAGAAGISLVAALGLALAAPVLAAEKGVSIADKTFTPGTIDVAVGDSVTWTVTKSIGEPHSVTSGKPADTAPGSIFDSGLDNLKDDGGTFTFKFEAEGTYDYFCQVHPEMVGKVVVTAAGGEGSEVHAPISPERKLLGGAILAVTLVVLFIAAWFWRRMNPA